MDLSLHGMSEIEINRHCHNLLSELFFILMVPKKKITVSLNVPALIQTIDFFFFLAI